METLPEEQLLLDRDDITRNVRELGLPYGEYAVFGSGPMVVHNLRQTSDIDIIATKELYAQLRNSGHWQERKLDDGASYLVQGFFKVMASWNYSTYRPSVARLIQEAEPVEGIPFVLLVEVYKWKQAFDRPKDRDDLRTLRRIFDR